MKTPRRAGGGERGLDIFLYSVAHAQRPRRRRASGRRSRQLRAWGLRTNPDLAALCHGLDEVLAYCAEWREQARRARVRHRRRGGEGRLASPCSRSSASPPSSRAGPSPTSTRRARRPPWCATSSVYVGRTGKLTPVALPRPGARSPAPRSPARPCTTRRRSRARTCASATPCSSRRAATSSPRSCRWCSRSGRRTRQPWTPPDACPVCGTEVVQAGRRGGPPLPERLLPGADRGAPQALRRPRGHGHRGPGRRARAPAARAGAGARLRRPLRADARGQLAGLERMAREVGARTCWTAIEASKDRELRRLLFGLGIRFVGERAAHAPGPPLPAAWTRSQAASVEEIDAIYEIGPAVAESVDDWFARDAERGAGRAAEEGRACAPTRPRGAGRLGRASRGSSSCSPAPWRP